MPITPLNQVTTQDINKEIDQLANDLERLKGTYEQYFLGLERREPAQQREKVAQMVRKYSGVVIQSTRSKFRFQQIVARYNTFTTYWDRVLKEIEEGRYQRDVFKYKIHHSDDKETKPKEKSGSAKPKAADPMLTLFNKFVEEKKKCNEEVKTLSFEKFKTQLEGQVETLKKKSGAANIKLQVVTENGKAKIKAVPQAAKK